MNFPGGDLSTIAGRGVFSPGPVGDIRRMGIRYYAYAFDADMTEAAVAYPRLILGRDPLADAWGLPEGFVTGTTNFLQRPPLDDMLYLDKKWRELQEITEPRKPESSELDNVIFGSPASEAEARPAYRMFEGDVHQRGDGWEPWLRTITPQEVPEIVADLCGITEADYANKFDDTSEHGRESDLAAVTRFLDKARRFVRGLEATGRGFVYMIG